MNEKRKNRTMEIRRSFKRRFSCLDDYSNIALLLAFCFNPFYSNVASIGQSIVHCSKSSFPVETIMNRNIQGSGHAKKQNSVKMRFYFEY